MRRAHILPLLLIAALTALRAAGTDGEASRVVIVANSVEPESVALASYYAAARGIPEANVIALPMSREESVGWDEFISTILDPLRARLVGENWVEGIVSALRDEFGRRRVVCTGHRISYLVLCRGVPLKISQNDQWLASASNSIREPRAVSNGASVDSELSTLAMSGTALNGQVPNPLFRRPLAEPLFPDTVVRVARLDGPTARSARDLVDNAIAAERSGLAGRAYIDLSGWHPAGDGWLEANAKTLEEAGFEVDIDRPREVMPSTARFDAPALYFGWYGWDLSGPMAAPGFRFPPGAIAVHIHSFSADTLRSDSKGWCGPLIARGVTATLGNVHEPYLLWTNQLDLFLEALMEGRTFGDAGYHSIPVLSWQGVLIGDPLYRPFAMSFSEQWENRDRTPAEVRTALFGRRIRLLLRSGASDEAMRLSLVRFREAPSIASGLLLAETAAAIDGPTAAPQHLRFIAMLERIEPLEIGVALAAARRLAEWGAHADAFAAFRRILVPPVPSWAGEIALIEEALREANLAGTSDGVEELESRLGRLREPATSPGS